MVFKRRDKQTLWQRLRGMFLPKKGWDRGLRYMGHRVRRIPDTPHKIALGAAIGVFVCFSPLFGLHMLMAIFLTFLLRGNVVAALITTWFGNPLTFPVIIATTMKFGRMLMGHETGGEAPESIMMTFRQAFHSMWVTAKSWVGIGAPSTAGLHSFFVDIFLPYMLGSLILGGAAALLTYYLTLPAIRSYQLRRRAIIAARRAERAAQKSSADSTRKAD